MEKGISLITAANFLCNENWACRYFHFLEEKSFFGTKSSSRTIPGFTKGPWPAFCALAGKRKAIPHVKKDSSPLSKQARAVIQMAGAVLLVLGIQAISSGSTFSAGLLLPVGGWLFGRSMAE
jgi:hypothetical protein